METPASDCSPGGGHAYSSPWSQATPVTCPCEGHTGLLPSRQVDSFFSNFRVLAIGQGTKVHLQTAAPHDILEPAFPMALRVSRTYMRGPTNAHVHMSGNGVAISASTNVRTCEPSLQGTNAKKKYWPLPKVATSTKCPGPIYSSGLRQPAGSTHN